jgi:hypothetical protein
MSFFRNKSGKVYADPFSSLSGSAVPTPKQSSMFASARAKMKGMIPRFKKGSVAQAPYLTPSQPPSQRQWQLFQEPEQPHRQQPSASQPQQAWQQPTSQRQQPSQIQGNKVILDMKGITDKLTTLNTTQNVPIVPIFLGNESLTREEKYLLKGDIIDKLISQSNLLNEISIIVKGVIVKYIQTRALALTNQQQHLRDSENEFLGLFIKGRKDLDIKIKALSKEGLGDGLLFYMYRYQIKYTIIFAEYMINIFSKDITVIEDFFRVEKMQTLYQTFQEQKDILKVNLDILEVLLSRESNIKDIESFNRNITAYNETLFNIMVCILKCYDILAIYLYFDNRNLKKRTDYNYNSVIDVNMWISIQTEIDNIHSKLNNFKSPNYRYLFESEYKKIVSEYRKELKLGGRRKPITKPITKPTKKPITKKPTTKNPTKKPTAKPTKKPTTKPTKKKST